MRAALAAVPDGTYEGEDWLDDDAGGGGPVAVRVRVTDRRATRARFDFSGTDDAARGPVNTTPFIAAASVFYVVKTLFGPEIQPSGGCYRPLGDRDPPRLPARSRAREPRGGRQPRDLAADRGRRVQAPSRPWGLSASPPAGRPRPGLVLFGGRRADGAWTTLYEVHGGGEGARHDRDGAPVVRVHMSNVMNTPAEVVEAEYPIRIECQRLRPDSGGGWPASGRRGPAPRLPRARRRDVGDVDVRAPRRAALRPAGRRATGRPSASPSHVPTAAGRTCRARRTCVSTGTT